MPQIILIKGLKKLMVLHRYNAPIGGIKDKKEWYTAPQYALCENPQMSLFDYFDKEDVLK